MLVRVSRPRSTRQFSGLFLCGCWVQTKNHPGYNSPKKCAYWVWWPGRVSHDACWIPVIQRLFTRLGSPFAKLEGVLPAKGAIQHFNLLAFAGLLRCPYLLRRSALVTESATLEEIWKHNPQNRQQDGKPVTMHPSSTLLHCSERTPFSTWTPVGTPSIIA